MAVDELVDPARAPGRAESAGTGRLRRLGWYVLLTGLSLMILFPVYMAIVRAISFPRSYMTAGSPPYPTDIEWSVWTDAFTKGGLGSKLVVSATMTAIIVTAQVITSLLAAYAFAFLQFPFKRVAFAVFMATLLLPIEVTLIPNINTIQGAGLMNSIAGLTLPFLATGFGTFLIRQGFLGVPRDLRDAAALDGFGHLAFLRRVAIPVTRPVIASYTLLAFLTAWNQYTWPRVAVTERQWETVQIGLRALATQSPDTSNIGFAGALIAALPIVVLLVLFQRHLIRGLTAGAVKG